MSRTLAISPAARSASATSRRACNDEAKVDYGHLDHLLGYAIARANVRGDTTFYAKVGDRSVTPLRYAMLELVGANPGLHQVQLAGALGLSRPAVTLLLDYWQAQDCVERRAAPLDRRSFGIFLTAAGGTRLAELRVQTCAHDRELGAALSAGERAELTRLLGKLESCAN